MTSAVQAIPKKTTSQADSLLRRGNDLFNKGRFLEASQILEHAVEQEPENPQAHKALANTYRFSNQIDKAIVHINKAIALAPDNILYRFLLAEYYELANKIDQALDIIDKAEKINELPPTAIVFKARLFRRQKNYEEALSLLRNINTNHPQFHEEAHIMAVHEMGLIFEKLERFDEAYAQFAHAKSLTASSHKMKTLQESGDQNHYERMRVLRSLFQKPWIDSWTKAPKPDRPEPILLIGFPRSGTTLLERMLGADNKIKVLSELSVLQKTIDYMQQKSNNMLDQMANLDKQELLDIQQQYYQNASVHTQITGKQILLDKIPMKTMEAGLFKRIFPRGKIILMLRHPCDCIFSAFKQNFTLHNGTQEFLSLEKTVRYYINLFSLIDHYETVFDNPFYKIRYEDLVNNPEHEMRTLTNHLGLKFQDKMLQHHKHKSDMDIISASYEQVNRPIYKDAQYHWKNYEKYMQPYLPALQPWIKKFGYAEEN